MAIPSRQGFLEEWTVLVQKIISLSAHNAAVDALFSVLELSVQCIMVISKEALCVVDADLCTFIPQHHYALMEM